MSVGAGADISATGFVSVGVRWRQTQEGGWMTDKATDVCPQCDGDLEAVGAHWHCAECDLTFF